MPRVARKAKSRSITELYDELRKAVAPLAAMPENARSTVWDTRLTRCNRLAKQIVQHRAASIEEMLLKINVVGWSASAVGLNELDGADDWQPDRFTEGDEYDALVSIREDLRRLKQAA